MTNQNVQKKKELINAYWFMLIILAVVSLVNLLAIAEDNLKAAAIVNFVFLILIPVIFTLGYIDYRNYAPLSRIKEIAYCATAVVAMWITLIHFNVQNYTFLSQYTNESTYLIGVSVLAALYFAAGFICMILSCMNTHNRRKQVICYYVIAVLSVISSVFMLAFNYCTYVKLFEYPLLLMNITSPIVVDTGITVLALRVLVEYCVFLYQAIREKRKKLLPNGAESEFRKDVTIMSAVAVVFMLVNLIVLPILEAVANIDYLNGQSYIYAYEVIEFISVAVLLSVGTAIAFRVKKSEKYGQIYKRMGVASVVFALVYLVSDFFPITQLVKAETEAQAQIAYDVFSSCIQICGLIGYTLYITLDKKLVATVHALDREHIARFSSENYNI